MKKKGRDGGHRSRGRGQDWYPTTRVRMERTVATLDNSALFRLLAIVLLSEHLLVWQRIKPGILYQFINIKNIHGPI